MLGCRSMPATACLAACLVALLATRASAGDCPWTGGQATPLQQLDLTDLPGFTRTAYAVDHALVTPESRVYAPVAGWSNTLGAVLVSPQATGAHFTMYLLNMACNSTSSLPISGAERFLFVLDGALDVTAAGTTHALVPDDFAYFPPGLAHTAASSTGATVLMYEQMYVEPTGAVAALANGKRPQLQVGSTAKQPLLPVAPEVFGLRKLLPLSAEYDFNMHVMTFEPGEFLLVKETHFNQHGLLLLDGQGVYRLADKWYPVKAGDAVWMAPFVVQWYGALGKTQSRYIINKDTNRDPLARRP